MIKHIVKKIINYPALKVSGRKLIILSDDWGSVRLRSKCDQEALIEKGLVVNNRFDQYDALETNDDLELLYEVLTKYKDHKGNHPLITAVANVANPDFEKIKESNFQDYYYESIDETYQRYPHSDKVMSLIKKGIENKIFIPQSHGREHVQVNWWMNELQDEKSYARKMFEHKFFFLYNTLLTNTYRNRDIVAAFDVLNLEDISLQKEILQDSLNIFESLFGYKSSTFTPPVVYFNKNLEHILFENGVKWLNSWRFVKMPKPNGSESFQFNYFGKRKKSGVRVLVRNGMFEPNITDSDDGVDRALYDIENAFRAKQPIVLSNHRAAFVSRIDAQNRSKGLKALDKLLRKVLEKWPDVEFITPDQLSEYAS